MNIRNAVKVATIQFVLLQELLLSILAYLHTAETLIIQLELLMLE